MPSVRLLTGTARSDRAARIDRLLIDRLDESLLIVPTHEYADRRTAEILETSGRPGFLYSPVITFQDFVTRILEGAPERHAKLRPLEQRILLQRALHRVREDDAVAAVGDAAETEGFLDHLLHIITQIKQAEVTPTAFARALDRRGNPTSLDRAVAAVYESYQHELKQAGAVDLPGMYWLARIECEAGRPPAFANVHRLLIDGFDDFTPSEFSLIAAAATHLDELVFGLHYDTNPRQRNLYALPRATHGKIRAAFGEHLETPEIDETPPEAETEFVAQSLLLRERPRYPGNLRHNISLIECHTIDHEVETIARHIKRLVREQNIPLSEIAVVWRRLAPVAGVVRDVFAECGIPVRGVHRRPLAESAIASHLLRFFDAAGTRSLSDVLDVLTSRWFAGPDSEYTSTFPILVRAARPRPTRDGWLASVERLRGLLERRPNPEICELVDHIPNAVSAASQLFDAVQRFGEQASRFARPDTPRAFLDETASLFAQWSIDDTLRAMAAYDDGSATETEFEHAAWTEIRNLLGELLGWHAGDDRRISPSDFANLLKRAFESRDVTLNAPKYAVSCLDMESARYLNFDYVFLAGMTQGEVPQPPPNSAIYDKREREELRKFGVPLDQAETHSQREILLFQRMFTTARTSLVITWHGLTRGGQVAGPSLFLAEVADILDLPVQRASEPKDILVPSPELVACGRDYRNFAFAGGVHAPELRRRFPHHAAAAAIERRRHANAPHDHYDGVLAIAQNRQSLAQTYSGEHLFSVSQLETYADCPFRFFQERVLGLFSVDPPEQVFDHLARGSVLHDALENFHKEHHGYAIADLDPGKAAARMRACGEAAFDRIARRYPHLGKGLLDAEKTRILETLQRYLTIEGAREQDRAWKPVHFEFAFGYDREAGEEPVPPPYVMALNGESVKIAGKIDRVDSDGDALRLIDYKSSKTANKAVEDGKSFQLAVYALAADERLFEDTPCNEAVYLAIGKSNAHTVALSRDNDRYAWDERVAIAREAVAAAVAGIRAGRFPPTSEPTPCRGCAAETVCRYQRARMLRKQAANP